MKIRLVILTVLFIPIFGVSYFTYAPNTTTGSLGAKAAAQATQWDFGDAPDPPYPSLLASNGARHIDITSEWLGTVLPTAMPPAGCVNLTTLEADAKIPDLDNDDGLASWWYNPVTGGLFTTVLVSTSPTAPPGTRYLNVLIDLNQNGTWSDAGEWAIANLPLDLAPGTCNFPVTVSLGTVPVPILPAGFTTWIRFTITRDPIPGTYVGTGQFASGETEDWQLTWSPTLPPGGGGPAPRPPVLAFQLSCRPKFQKIFHGTLAPFVLTSTGNVRPNRLRVQATKAGQCDPAGAWIPDGSPVDVSPPASVLPFAVSFQSNPRHTCFLPSQNLRTFLATYYNLNPGLGPVGVVASGATCECDVNHPPDPDPSLLGVIKGRVADDTGQPVTGAHVLVIDSQGTTMAGTTTNGSGKYKIKKLPAGPYIVDSFFDVFVNLAETKPAAVEAGATTRVDFVLQRPAEIKVHVVGKDSSGGPVPPPSFFDVEILPLDISGGLLPAFSEPTGPDGRFSTGPIMPGDYKVRAAGQGFEPAERAVKVASGQSLEVEINPNKTPFDLGIGCDLPPDLGVAQGACTNNIACHLDYTGCTQSDGCNANLECSAPPGITCDFGGSSTLKLPQGSGSVPFTFRLCVGAGVAGGGYDIQLSVTSGAITKALPARVTVKQPQQPPDFQISCNPATISSPPVGTAQSTCSVQALNGFSGAVSLSCQGLPQGAGCSLNPNPVMAPGMSTLVVNVAQVPPGGYSFQVVGTSSSLQHSFGMQLNVGH